MPRPNVLIVEDEAMLGFDLEALANHAGCDVTGPVSSLKGALAAARKPGIDFAILDLNLHGEMTYPVADALIAAGIPFLFLSGHERKILPERFSQCDFVQKPYTSKQIAECFAALQDRSGKSAAGRG